MRRTRGSAPLFDSHPSLWFVEKRKMVRAIEKAPRLRPDLIVIDMSMPVMNGPGRRTTAHQDPAPLCGSYFSSTHDFPELCQLARSAGIHAVVQKARR